jgi:hypothetical protein
MSDASASQRTKRLDSPVSTLVTYGFPGAAACDPTTELSW